MKRDPLCTLQELGIQRGRVPNHVKDRCGFVTEHHDGVTAGWCGEPALYRVKRHSSAPGRHGLLCAEHAAVTRQQRDPDLERMSST